MAVYLNREIESYLEGFDAFIFPFKLSINIPFLLANWSIQLLIIAMNFILKGKMSIKLIIYF